MARMNRTIDATRSNRKSQGHVSIRHLRFESLEQRELLAVLNLNVYDEADLIDAIDQCNDNPNLMGRDTITIKDDITLTEELPVIEEGIIIDGDVSGRIPIIDGDYISMRGFVIEIGSQYPNNDQYRAVTISDLYIRDMGASAIEAVQNVRTLEVVGVVKTEKRSV